MQNPSDAEDPSRSDANLRTLVEKSPFATCVDVKGLIRWVNPALLVMLGYEDAGELVGRPTISLVHPDDHAALYAREEKRTRGESVPPIVVRYVRTDGTSVPVEGLGTKIVFDGEPAVLVMVQDISRRLRAEEEREAATRALRLSEERYRFLFDSFPLPTWLFDRDTLRISAVNEAAVQLYGYSRDEFLAMRITDIKIPYEVSPMVGAIRTLPNGIHRVGVRRHRKKDGTLLDVDVSAHAVEMDGGRSVLAIATDVTSKRRLEGELNKAQKMEAIGQLAGGVAHDFNNMLAVILADADFALRALDEDHPARADIEEIAAVTRRAATLVRQLLTFSRRQPRQPEVLALNDLVSGAERMLSGSIGDEILMSVVLASRLGSIEADPGQVEQIVVNLVLNARDAIAGNGSGKGKITVETSNVDIDAGAAGESPSVAPGRYVVLTVTDDGQGMDAATKQRIFEPFFTTKPFGKGTGLGLSTVLGIVEQSGGAITVDSDLGAGTTMRVYFPRIEGYGRSTPRIPQSPLGEGAGTTGPGRPARRRWSPRPTGAPWSRWSTAPGSRGRRS